MKTSNCYSELLQQFPEYMTKNQMYKVCHISKKTCLFLLENGLVPCIDSGKKTRRFKIETNAVIHYLEDRDLRPELYRPPEGFYKKKQSELNRALTEDDLLIMRQFYEAALKRYPDVLTTKQISEFTGYGESSVVRWCGKQQLRSFYILPSEKAFAYKMKLEAMRRQQGERTDLTSVPLGQKSGQTSRELLASNSPDSNTQIQRYIRLTFLIPPLLDMVDEGKIAMRPAVELSYLSESEQTMLHDTMELEDCTPSHAQARKMREFSENGKLNEKVILSIMQEEKPNQKEQFRMPRERISKYFTPGTPAKTIEDTIVKALELYRKRQRSMER